MNWLNQQLFNDFLAMRIEAKQVKINTERSIKMLLNKLENWHNIGYDTDVILRTCTEKQYRGLWLPPGLEPKQKHLRAAAPVRQAMEPLLNKIKLPPPPSDADKQRRADEARAEAKRLLGL